MNTSLEWLRDFLPGPALDAQRCADALMNGGFPVERIERVGDDAVLDVEVTSNRSDCLSHAGVARELSALLDRVFQLTEPAVTEVTTSATSVTGVTIEAPQLCPHYTARVIRGVKVGPSPAWMVRRLEAVGLRSINNVVDVTNYVMFELGQPLHAFDLDRLSGRRIVVREARLGEKLASIDGHERRLAGGMLVIADAERPVALAGVMGGLESEVSAATVNVLLESARFDPLSVRRTARALAMKSDSSYRFERGIDPTLPDRASRRAAQLILETAGGELLKGVAEAGDGHFTPRTLTLRLEKLRRVLGIDVLTDRVVDALRRVQLAPVMQGDGSVRVTVPSWRLDLGIEVDLVEEVARVIGYDQVPVRDEVAIRLTAPSPEARAMETIRSALVSAGYFEAVTFSFVTDALAGDFVPPEATSLPRADAGVRKSDARLRPSLLPGLLEAVRRNETSGTPGARLFETGATFWHAGAGVEERRWVGLVGGRDLRDVRGVVEAVLNRLDAHRPVTVVPHPRPGYAPGAAGQVLWGDEPVGHLGRVDPAVADKLGLRDAPAAAELELTALLAGAQLVPQLRPLPKFPAVERDLSFVLPDQTPYERLAGIVARLRPAFLEDVRHVETYRGKPIERGHKSVTIALVFRSPTETLTGQQVEQAVQPIVDAARSELGATLRA
jgi:phenylalanyl-tRNA synthetase beta chain